MPDEIKLDLTDLLPGQVADLLERAREHREKNAVDEHSEDDGSWRDAISTGWTREHVDLLRENLKQRGKTVQLDAFDAAVKNGGFVSRDEVYRIGGYLPSRKLNNWTAPINNFSESLVATHGLPDDAAWPIETEYGEGSGYRPAIGFTVAPEIVKLLRT